MIQVDLKAEIEWLSAKNAKLRVALKEAKLALDGGDVVDARGTISRALANEQDK